MLIGHLEQQNCPAIYSELSTGATKLSSYWSNKTVQLSTPRCTRGNVSRQNSSPPGRHYGYKHHMKNKDIDMTLQSGYFLQEVLGLVDSPH